MAGKSARAPYQYSPQHPALPVEPALSRIEAGQQGRESVATALAGPPNQQHIDNIMADTAMRDGMDARFAAEDRGFAAEAGVPYPQWQRLEGISKDRLLNEARMRAKSDYDETQEQITSATFNPLAAMAGKVPLITDTEFKQFENPSSFSNYANRLLGPHDYDHKGRPTVTVLCDPPIEVVLSGERMTVHPGTSKISLAMVEIKRRQGFESYPKYPFLPDPHLPCEMSTELVFGPAGRPCGYLGRTKNEVMTHMELGHPMEFRSRLRRLEEERQTADREEQRAEREERRQYLTLLTEMVRQGRELPAGAPSA